MKIVLPNLDSLVYRHNLPEQDRTMVNASGFDALPIQEHDFTLLGIDEIAAHYQREGDGARNYGFKVEALSSSHQKHHTLKREILLEELAGTHRNRMTDSVLTVESGVSSSYMR